ncbi:MAG TPA: hypothetical protein VFP37_03960 [Steroidobacteraceae bacterium]|nr:hypothetical protein [Steroidobacteraceae bacterium]
MMFAGAGGIVVGSFATTRILGSVQERPAIATAQSAVHIDAKQARDWLQSTLARGRWMSHADPAFQTAYVLRPGQGYDAMKPGVAVASNRVGRPADDRQF